MDSTNGEWLNAYLNEGVQSAVADLKRASAEMEEAVAALSAVACPHWEGSAAQLFRGAHDRALMQALLAHQALRDAVAEQALHDMSPPLMCVASGGVGR